MDKNLYETMQRILEEKKAMDTKTIHHTDIKFVGTMTYDKETETGTVGTTKDVFAVIAVDENGNIIEKFYDSDNKYLRRTRIRW